jgi:SagB-type dehydrogenase family enzyme
VLSTLHAGGDVEYPQSRRLYPGGGASYELDLVLTTLGVGSLPAGVWWFDPERVVLCRMTSDPAHIDALFADAKISTGGVGRIEVLVSYALRMGRNSWKYEGMAYRLALLDAGVLYGHAYLLAAALGFGVCGLGNGDSSVLARVTEASGDDLVSVAEIMLTGSR